MLRHKKALARAAVLPGAAGWLPAASALLLASAVLILVGMPW